MSAAPVRYRAAARALTGLLALQAAAGVALVLLALSASPRSVAVASLGFALALSSVAAAAIGWRRILPRWAAEDAAVRASSEERARLLDLAEDGFLLLDAQHIVRGPVSASLGRLLGRDAREGMAFSDVLAPLATEKLRATAMSYVGTLWSERVNEKLVRTLNPLHDVAVHRDDGAGGSEVRRLAFEFRRVTTADGGARLLVTVSDATERLAAVRELTEAREHLQEQLDTLGSILETEPQVLRTFVSEAENAVQQVNAILRVPAREEAAFRDKLDRIEAQIAPLRTGSERTGFAHLETRARAFEENVAELRKRARLTGNDFLPLAVQLDGLFASIGAVRELFGRIASLHAKLDAPVRSAAPSRTRSGDDIAEELQQLTQSLAAREGKKASLVCLGLEDLPPDYAEVVRRSLAQLLRHAIVRGIEPVTERVAAAKPASGTMIAELVSLGDEGFELTFQDDGRGLDHESIVRTAIERGFVSPEAAARTDPRRLAAYIFRPGFRVDAADEDGRGMSAMRDQIAALGGRISVATRNGAFTRFCITLPAGKLGTLPYFGKLGGN